MLGVQILMPGRFMATLKHFWIKPDVKLLRFLAVRAFKREMKQNLDFFRLSPMCTLRTE